MATTTQTKSISPTSAVPVASPSASTNTQAAYQTQMGQTPTALATQAGVSQSDLQAYQAKYPGANPDALIGSILMDKAKQQKTVPAPTVVDSDLAKDTATKQVTDLKSMQGSSQAWDNPQAAKDAGFGGSLGYNPSTGKYEPLESLQAKNASKANVGATTEQAKAQATAGFEDSLDAMAKSILTQLNARPGAIDLATQNQIKMIQQVMADRRAETEKLNAAQDAAMKTIGITSGRTRYAPEVQTGIMTDVAVQGLKRVQAIDAQEQQLISEALSQAEDKKFEALNKTYEFVQQLKKDKAAALKDVAEAAKAQRDTQIAEEKHAWDRLEFMDKQLDTGIERMAKASADGSFTPTEDDFQQFGETYGYSPEAVKGMFEVSLKSTQLKSAKDQAEYKKLVMDAGTSLWSALDKVPAGQSITIDGHQYFGTQGTGKTEIDPNGIGYQFTVNQSTGKIERLNLGYVGKKEEGWETKTDQYNRLWRVNANSGQMTPMFVGDATKKFASIIPDGTKGTPWRSPNDPNAGQCGANANDCYDPKIGKVWTNTIDEKLEEAKPWEVPKEEVRVNDTLIIQAGGTGHVAIVNQVETKDGKTVLRLSESNWNGDLKQTNDRPLNADDPSILKVARIPLRPELLSGPDTSGQPAVGTYTPLFGTKSEEQGKPLTASEAEYWTKQGYAVKPGDTLSSLKTQTPSEGKTQSAVAQGLKDKLNDIDALLGNKVGLEQAVGPNMFARGGFEAEGQLGWHQLGSPLLSGIIASMNPEEKQDFSAGVMSLISKETMDSLTNLKARGGTLGALSENELRMLQDASTKINSWIIKKDGEPTGEFRTSEKNMVKELGRLRALTQRAYINAKGLDDYAKETGFDVAQARADGKTDEEIIKTLSQL